MLFFERLYLCLLAVKQNFKKLILLWLAYVAGIVN